MRLRVMALMLFIILVLAGCSNQELNFSDQYVFGQDSQYNLINKGGISGSLAETNDGYFFLSGPARMFLYYYDKGEKQVIPVCNKPNCLHADESDSYKIADCNSFLGVNVIYLNYYRESIYYVLQEISITGIVNSLYKISLDGFKRQKIFDFKEQIANLQIHRGYVIYATSDSGTTGGKEATTKTTFSLCRISLDNIGLKPEIIEQGVEVYGQIGEILCYGNNVYYSAHYYTDAAMENDISYTSRYNIITKKTDRIRSDGCSQFTIYKNKLVYILAQKGTYISDLDGNNPVKLCDDFGYYSANDKYLFIDTYFNKFMNKERKLMIYDEELSLIKSISLANYTADSLGCSNEFYFVSTMGKTNDFGEIVTLDCIPVDKISDDMNPREFFDFVPKVHFTGINRNLQ